mgnify:FL=1
MKVTFWRPSATRVSLNYSDICDGFYTHLGSWENGLFYHFKDGAIERYSYNFQNKRFDYRGYAKVRETLNEFTKRLYK